MNNPKDKGAAMTADPRPHRDRGLESTAPLIDESHTDVCRQPNSLREALRSAHGEANPSPADSTSEDDYDNDHRNKPVTVLLRRAKGNDPRPVTTLPRSSSNLKAEVLTEPSTPTSQMSTDTGGLHDVSALKDTKVYTVTSDDKELRTILKRIMQKAKQDTRAPTKRKGRFRDYVFTKKFSTFDARSEVAATSPFYGFFTLFWMAVAIMLLKIGAENWRKTGNPLGTNDMIRYMFKRDVAVLLLSDGVMCALTGVSWILQLLIHKGYMDWDGAGWIVQNLWQTTFIGMNIGWTHLRDWPWSHTVFFVLHTLVMLMKQHSYSFYNGYLSTAYKKRVELQRRLKQLEEIETSKATAPTEATASAIAPEYLSRRPSANEIKQRRRSLHSGSDGFNQDLDRIEATLEANKPLDLEQIRVFEKVIQWEIDGLTEELMGKATSSERAYPRNLTMKNHYEYIVFPTVVYELEYPRSETIDWRHVVEKAAATFGVIFVMIAVSQAFIYPVVMRTQHMKETGMPLADRFREFPWMLADLIFPLMMEYLLSWYVIWEAILNLLGELTYFADREFYSDWWNSVSWDQFARDWNRPVHNFLLRHVYHSSISAMQVNKHTATLITFFLSACVHELVMWCIFKKLRGYLLVLQMMQLPLVRLSRTKWLKGRQTLGNMIFWLGIFTGPSILCSLYLIL